LLPRAWKKIARAGVVVGSRSLALGSLESTEGSFDNKRSTKANQPTKILSFLVATSPFLFTTLHFAFQNNKMIIFEDVHCGDEMISDAFDLSV
jgi:hypothetical protein